MTGSISPAASSSPVGGGGRTGNHFGQNIIAAGVCLAWNAGFLAMSLALPEGHSRGDVGPGALPLQIAIFGLLVSAVYLVQVLRGVDLGGSGEKVDVPRVAGLVGLFAAAAVSSGWIGLPISLALGTGVATLLFPGERPLLRAVLTGAGFWAIAYFLFGRLLGLPLP
jgi:hypothetical protein